MSVEEQLREAMSRQVAAVPRPPDRWEEIAARAAAARHRPRYRRRVVGLTSLGLAATAAAVVASVILLTNGRQPRSQRVSTRPPVMNPAPPGSTPVSTPATGKQTPTTSRPRTTGSTAVSGSKTGIAPYQPLWPFRTLAEAQAWEASNRSGGHQPWHLDAGQTSLSFTSGYLGYSEINTVIAQKVDGKGAHVSVGFLNPNGQPSTAAVIHLVRFGTDPDAPWEVVGTDDTPAFALTAPPYGSSASSPLTVGGTITGVDENIVVQVLGLSASGPLGTSAGVPAGGTVTPWRTTVSFSTASDPVLTVAAATGGHLQRIERFTVTAVVVGR
ncbi:MAG TPA: hypothetical protein VF942_04180 [Acidimicrobiales bacterium]